MVDYNNPRDGLDSNVIQVDPSTLWHKHHKQLDSYVKIIGDEVTDLRNKWNDLYLRWQGPDAATAEDFMSQLDAAFVALFGPPGVTSISDLKSGEGSLIRLSTGINLAAQNYGGAEESVREMMMDFAHALMTGSDGGPDAWQGTRQNGPVSEYRGWGLPWAAEGRP
ncbi:hypothetical protein AB0H83_34305 [Dactylosporangium sp. NPDC050688]|uniref:WXG100 family type VII secretion target n=1 Tax=Dactylosporangium sp. NPDC050688 TaxID=3157217 RepID=UPI0033EBF001